MVSTSPADAPPRGADTSPPAGRPKNSASLGLYAYNVLREEIRSGALNPGERLRESQLAERLGISRTPVREALNRLTAEGLVSSSTSNGVCVNDLSISEVHALYAMREVLEGAAARFAAQHASTMELASLQDLVAERNKVRTPEDAAKHNRAVDYAIAQAAHNVFLIKALQALSDAVALLGPTTYSMPGRIDAGLAETSAIVAAIVRRDPSGAQEAAAQHVRSTGAIRITMRRARGSKF